MHRDVLVKFQAVRASQSYVARSFSSSLGQSSSSAVVNAGPSAYTMGSPCERSWAVTIG